MKDDIPAVGRNIGSERNRSVLSNSEFHVAAHGRDLGVQVYHGIRVYEKVYPARIQRKRKKNRPAR